MRIYYDINLTDRTIAKRDVQGEDNVRAGRYFIAKTLLELGAATVDPLSPANPLIFSAGPFAGTSFSNANRTSVGCKSPLTGGVKEANGGGTFSYGLGQLQIAGFTLHGASPELGGHPFQEGRHHRLRRRHAVPRQGQLRGGGDAARAVRQEGHHRALRPGRRVPGPDRGHRLQRQGRPPVAALRARRRGRGDGVQEGQGHRGRPRQDPAVPRAQEGQWPPSRTTPRCSRPTAS